MKLFSVLMFGILFSPIANAGALSCKQSYGDGYNVNLVISFGEEVKISASDQDLSKRRLPFLGERDGFIDYRTFSVTGYDEDPTKVVSGFTIGAFDPTSHDGVVALVDEAGKNIGVLYVRRTISERFVADIGVNIFGLSSTWTSCERYIGVSNE